MSLRTIYYNPHHLAVFSSVAKLAQSAKTNMEHVQEWLSGEDTYTLHKPVRKRFPRNPYTVTNLDDVWEMHLADLAALAKYNSNYRYLLNVIDVFSHYAWSVPLKH
jgi:truncated hemoglobin YjbI